MTTTVEPATESAASSLDEIAEEHHALGEALKRLERADDPAEILPQLDELRGLLERHFAGEEASDGLPETVSTNAPHLLASLEGIFDEHREFLKDLDVLAAESRACIGRIAELRSSVAEFVERMREHEIRETQLIGDAVYNDMGPAD